jgi:PH domain
MEFSGFLDEKGWRNDAPWKPRRFSLKGRVLRSYVGDQERSSYIIDAESFLSVIPQGVNENGTKSLADENHKYVFSICTKSFAPAFAKNKIILSAPNETSFNSWIKAFSECAFEGVTENIPELWPNSFRNQVNLFDISFNGRRVNNGSTFSSFQLEVAPLHTSSDTKAVQKNNLKLVKHLWSYSNSANSLSTKCLIPSIMALASDMAPGDIPVLPPSSHPGLKLYYTLILVSAQTMQGKEGHWVR